MDATLESLKRFDDPAQFTVKRKIPVFREHVIVTRDRKSGKEKSRWVVNKKVLEEIAEANNRRIEETGDLTPVSIGHTRKDKDGKPLPAKDQPPVIAYAKNYAVGVFGPKNIPCILADFYIEKGKEQELNKYPRRSPEFWDGEKFFDPIALLGAQTPQLDLGLVFYSRPADGRIYAKAEGDMPDLISTAEPTKKPDTSAGVADLGHEEDRENEEMEGMHEQYMKHCYGHPHAKMYHDAMCKKYAMPTEGEEAEVDNPPPMDDPNAMPYSRNGDAIQYQRVMAMVEGMKKRLDAVETENKRLREQSTHYQKNAAEADVKGRLELLARDGYEFSEKIEFKRMLGMTGQERDDHIAYARQTYRNSEEPTGGYAVPTSREPVIGQRDDGWQEVDGAPGVKHAEAALQYMKTSEARTLPLGEAGWKKALEIVKERRAARNGTTK